MRLMSALGRYRPVAATAKFSTWRRAMLSMNGRVRPRAALEQQHVLTTNTLQEFMSNRRIVNFSKTSQSELAHQFHWLMDVDLSEQRAEIQILSVSVFDHWLSREEACEKLENVPANEQARRNALLADFCSRMIAETGVLSFVQRGRQFRHILFRRFVSKEELSKYCRPGGGKVLRHRHFHVVLPEHGCVFYESWDDTYHFFFKCSNIEDAARVWADQSGVYLLSR